MLDDEINDQHHHLIGDKRIDIDRRHPKCFILCANKTNLGSILTFLSLLYGIPKYYNLDLLKLWVNTNQHTYDTEPPGYTPENTDMNERDDESPIFSMETSLLKIRAILSELILRSDFCRCQLPVITRASQLYDCCQVSWE